MLPSASQADQAKSEETAKSNVSLDKTQPVTNIQIRLADGSRYAVKHNLFFLMCTITDSEER